MACPLLVHQTLQGSLPEPAGFAAITVTSTNALRALIRLYIEVFRGLPILVITLARPELFDRRPDWGAVMNESASIQDSLDAMIRNARNV